MKKIKLLLTTLSFALIAVVLSTSVFAETITYDFTEDDIDNIYTFFEKGDSWENEDVYVNFVDSTTGNLAFDEPGIKMRKVLEKDAYEPILTISNDLYALPISRSSLTGNNFDQVIFSGGSDASNITDKTVASSLTPFRKYVITGGEKMAQTVNSTEHFDTTVVTTVQKEIRNLKNVNPELYNQMKDTLNSVPTLIQEIIAELNFYSFNELFEDLDEIKEVITSKDPNSIEALRKKIAEANEKITEEGYTDDSIQALTDEIPAAQNILDNEVYFSQAQIDSETETLDNLIKGLIPDTTELEKVVEEAKEIDTDKYTDDSVKNLNDNLDKAQEGLENKTGLTPDSVKELTNNLRDAIAALEEKTTTNESKNPATGDILAIILPILALATVTGIFTFVYSKKQK